jgi:serine/threonine protein kinase
VYSLADGTLPALVRAREVMRVLPGSYELLLGLLAFDPTKRPTMHTALQHTLFDSLRAPHMNSACEIRTCHYSASTVSELPVV